MELQIREGEEKYHTKFWARVDKSGDCWIWVGLKIHNGYGRFNFKGKIVLAHRLSYYFAYGEIPAGMYACHKCDNRSCVNPDHIFLGTAKDNSDDKILKGRSSWQKITHCPQGHEYTPENTYNLKRGERRCKLCNRKKQNEVNSIKRLTKTAEC